MRIHSSERSYRSSLVRKSPCRACSESLPPEMMCTTARPSESWSRVASCWAATVGKTVFGRTATIGLMRSVAAATAVATTNESAPALP